VIWPKSAGRWGGAAFMVGSVLFLVNKFNEMSRAFLSRPMPDVISGHDVGLVLLGQVLLVVGYAAFYRVYSVRARPLEKNALRLFFAGGTLLALGHVSFLPPGRLPRLPFDLFLLVLLGLAAMLLGLILFGIANRRQPILRRWKWLPLATGLAGFVGFFFFGGEEKTALFLAFRTLFALGLFGLGLALWLEEPTLTPSFDAGKTEATV